MFAVGSTLVTAALAQVSANAQPRVGPASNPGPEKAALRRENPSSNTRPATDHGDVGPIWYSFDLTKLQVEKGGWTHEVTLRQLPSSKDFAGVTMRLTSGSFRELHWHTADEWAMMLYRSARITVLNLDGTIFIEDAGKGDLWYFPAGYPHSIQGRGPDGCEFLLVFDEGHHGRTAVMQIAVFA